MIMMLNDCVCLQVLDGAVKEYRSGTGGLWGSSEEDNRFVRVLWSTTTFYASNSFCRVLFYLLVFLLNSVSNTFLFAEGNTCRKKNTYMCFKCENDNSRCIRNCTCSKRMNIKVGVCVFFLCFIFQNTIVTDVLSVLPPNKSPLFFCD